MANNTVLASDNWASGSLAAGWSALTALGNTPNVISASPNVTEPTSTSQESFIYWSALTWPNDQASEVTMHSLTSEGTTFVVLGVRLTPTNGAGYIMNLVGGTATVEYFNGTSPTTLFTATGITIAAGDTLTLQAAGSCVTLMHNGIRLGTVGDTNATSGYPGFGQASTTNVTHTQVQAWRGYSAVQQDGVWTKQGVVLAPNTTDLTGFGVYEASCMLDINPQLIGGTRCYKLWFSGGASGSFNCYYAESPDLINWTRQSAAVITGFQVPQVIKVGGTYYLYCQASTALGSGNIAYYTSPDGVNWTQESTNVLATGGTGGAWEGGSIYPLKPIAVVGGTWYALYGSLPSGVGKTGLVTSTDGAGAVWTKYVSNPVLPNGTTKGGVYPYQCFAQVGSTFYIWMQKCPTASMGATASPLFDPNDIVRYSTTDFINYSAPVASVHHTQIYEAVNTPVNGTEAVGGIAPTQIFNVGSVAKMLYLSTQGDAANPVIGQFSLAVAPSSIANLVQFNEDAVSQVATDAFIGGAGPLSANWSTVSGFSSMVIVSGNKAEPSVHTSVGCAAVYTTGSISSSQYAEITLATLASGGYLSPTVLMGTTTGACYMVDLMTGPTGTLGYKAAIAFYNGSTFTTLTGSVGITPTVGDVIRLSAVQVVGGVVLSLFQNGFLIAQGEDFSSTALTTGFPGFAGTENALSSSQISLFAAGNANTIPNYPSGGTFIGWSPLDSRQAVPGFGPAANTGIADTQGNEIFSAQDPPNPPFAGNSQVSDNASIPPQDCRVTKPTDCRVNIPVNSRAPQV